MWLPSKLQSCTLHKMRTQAVCVFLLCLAHCGTRADADDDWNPTDSKVLNTLLASKVGIQSSPYWKATLPNVCELLTTLNQDVLLNSEEDFDSRRSNIPKILEDVGTLQIFCGIMQPWKLDQTVPEFLDSRRMENSDFPPKRKIPYILKRQLLNKKLRRPYILRRSVDY